MRYFLVAIAVLFGLALQPAMACARGIVATVDGVPLTDTDIALRLSNDPELQKQSPDVPKARLEALRRLAVEIAAERALRGPLQDGRELRLYFDQARRQRILGYYDDGSTAQLELKQSEVDAFIAANPQFFAQRKTWHFHDIVVTATRPALVPALRAHAAQIVAAGDFGSGQIGAQFAWATDHNFDAVIVNQWLGTEQIPANVVTILHQLEVGPHRVQADCQAASCHFYVFHQAYDDPVDPRVSRDAIARGLLEQKRAAAIADIHKQLLKQAQIEFHDPQLAQLADKAWGLPGYLTATGFQKGLWAAQIILLCGALAWVAWQMFGRAGVAAAEEFRPRWTANLSDRTYWLLYGRPSQAALAAVIGTVVAGEALWSLTVTGFVKFEHDYAAIAAGSLTPIIAGCVAWRYSPMVRRMSGQRRYVAPILLVLAGLLLQISRTAA